MRDIRDKLAARLTADAQFERCGFVTKRGRIIEVKNIAEEPEKRFHICPKEVLKNRENIVATWHTHPFTDPNLSGDDYQCFLAWDDLVHYIVGRRDGEVAVVRYAVEDGMVIQS